MILSPPSTLPRVARVSVALCFVLIGGLIGSWVSRIPAIQTKLGLSAGHLGLVLLSPAFGAMVAMPFAGWCVGRLGSRWITWGMGCLLALSLPSLALASTPFWLALTLFFFGATFGGLDVAVNAQAVAVEQRYGRSIMSSFHALYSTGGLLGAWVGGRIADAGVAPPLHFCGASLVLGVPVLGYAFAGLLEASDATARVEPTPTETRPRGFQFPPLSLLALGVAAFGVMMAEGSIADWGAVYLKFHLGVSEGRAADGFSAFSLTMVLGRLVGDSLVRRLGPFRLVRLGGWLAATGLLAALLAHTLWIALAGFALVGAGLATIVPIIFSAAGRTQGYAAGPALSVVTTIGYAGFLLGPPLVGQVAEVASLRGALGIIVGMCVAVGWLARFTQGEEPLSTSSST